MRRDNRWAMRRVRQYTGAWRRRSPADYRQSAKSSETLPIERITRA